MGPPADLPFRLIVPIVAFAMGQPFLYSLGICVAGAVLEGLFAGRGVSLRLAELRLPRFAPPLWAWVLIGFGYYAICFAVSYRLFSAAEPTALTYASLTVLGGLMFVNALWNYVFFRMRSPYYAFLLSVPYSLLAASLFLVLLAVDRGASAIFSPYLANLLFGNIWGYRVWKLNPPSNESPPARRG
jgi:translocator protein